MANMIVWNDAHAEQKISYKIAPQPGSLFPLRSIGAQLQAIAKMLEAESPHAARCMLAGINMARDGSIIFNVIVAPKKQQSAGRAALSARTDQEGTGDER